MGAPAIIEHAPLADTVYAFRPPQLKLIRDTIAKDCDNDEFNLFIEMCRRYRLDPIKRQIYAIVTNKKNPEKRQLVVVTGIDGYRSIAARSGRYRGPDQRPDFEFDDAAKDPDTNPLGLVSCAVTVFKQDDRGEWHGVVGVAYWDEYAPIEDVWGEDPQTGKRRPTGKKKVKDMWAKMGRNQLAKCAEAQALRKGWPEDLGGIYASEEMDRTVANETATELVEQAIAEERQAKIGIMSDTIPMVWGGNDPIEFVPIGGLADRICGYLRTLDDPLAVAAFEARNRDSLRLFWGKAKNDALAVKKEIDAAKAGFAG